MCVSLCFQFVLSMYLGVELLDHLILAVAFWGTAKLYSIVAVHYVGSFTVLETGGGLSIVGVTVQVTDLRGVHGTVNSKLNIYT